MSRPQLISLPSLLLVGAALWLSSLFAAPLATHLGFFGAPLLYAIFDPLCHQIAERSFHFWGEPLAVCHRCAGLYSGVALGLLLWPRLHRSRALLLERGRWILLFFAPMAIDVALPWNTEWTRFTTGCIASFPVALLLLVAVEQLSIDQLRLAPRREQ